MRASTHAGSDGAVGGPLVLFGDPVGLPRLLRVVDREQVAALVRASARPEQEDELLALASEHSLPLLVQPRADEPDYASFVAELRAMEPELIVVDSYSMLLRADVLDLSRRGGVNVHHALLPRYRGPNPTQWALINDERETGTTLHRMTRDFDAGGVLAQRRVAIGIEDTWLDLHERLGLAAEQMLRETLPAVLAGSAQESPQEEAAATVSVRRRPEDGRIDWNASVLQIYNLIRALVEPLPGAFYELADAQVEIRQRLSFAEVIALKFGGPGGRELRKPAVRLAPLPAPGPAEAGIHLEVVAPPTGGRCGRVDLGVDWDQRIGTAVIEVGSPRLLSDVRELTERLALAELGLAELKVGARGPRGA